MTRDDTREHILQTAARLFALHGFDSTSMNDIVRETGVSKGGIYWHFENKEALIEAVFDQYFQAQLDALIVLNQQGSASDARLRVLIHAIVDGLCESSHSFPKPLAFYAYALRDEKLLSRFRHYFHAYNDHLAVLIQQGIDDAEFAPIDAHQAAHILLSTFEGLILIHALTEISADCAALSERFTTAGDLFITGLQRPKGA